MNSLIRVWKLHEEKPLKEASDIFSGGLLSTKVVHH